MAVSVLGTSLSGHGTGGKRSLRVDAELTWSLALRDIRVRYRRSVGGFLWSMGKPVLLTVILWAVFSHLLRIPFNHDGVPYWLFMLCSIVGWNFTVGTLMDGTHSVCGNGHLIRKVPLNAGVFPLSVLVGNLFHFCMALVVLLTVVVAGGWLVSPWGLVALPVVMVAQALFLLALILVTSSLQVFYRDVGNGLDLVAMAWFYASPILYPLDLARGQLTERLGEWAWWLYLCNPPAVFSAAMRRCLFFGANAELPDSVLAAAFVAHMIFALAMLALARRLFNRLSERFADEL